MASIEFGYPHNSPATHVLIIGIGAYPYLRQLKEDPGFNDGPFSTMNQLTSPPLSAMAFYQTVLQIQEKSAWAAPLGSITILVSNHDTLHTSIDAPQSMVLPTRENIEKAYRDWKKLCDQHPDNIAIFYFCGHGISKEDDYLLAMDFMKDPLQPAAKAINLQKTVRAFHSCMAKRKIFLIDACRSVPSEVLLTDFSPLGLEAVKYLGQTSYCFTQQSTGPGAAAFGQGVSFYTQALNRALLGQACEDNTGEGWAITTGSLGMNMNTILESIVSETAFKKRNWDIDQYCTQDYMQSFPIIRYMQPPDVKIEVEALPLDIRPQTRMYCYDMEWENEICRCDPQPETWCFTLPAGIYAFVGQTTSEPVLSSRRIVAAKPPRINPKLQII